MNELFTIGFTSPVSTRWQRLSDALRAARVDVLVDIRHSPCASDPDPDTKSHYGPRAWNLQLPPDGIVNRLENAGISYLWLVELGNPQKRDPQMKILRHHLSQADGWPVHRGLAMLRDRAIVKAQRCCLLCACEDYNTCHRRLIAEAFRKVAGIPDLAITDLTKGF